MKILSYIGNFVTTVFLILIGSPAVSLDNRIKRKDLWKYLLAILGSIVLVALFIGLFIAK